jgi:NAD/NADP transhydrogenase beta subunit
VAYQVSKGNGVGYGPVFSTPTVGVVKQSNSGFAVAGIDNPLFCADPTTMLRRRPTERRELTDELKAV